MEIFFVFIGGALGALLRYYVYSLPFPVEYGYLPTFIVNMLGCLIIGFCAYLLGRRKDMLTRNLKSLTTIGLAGGLTTFSTFALDLFRFSISTNFVGLFLYLVLSVILGVCLVSVGINSAYSLMVAIIRSRKGRAKRC